MEFNWVKIGNGDWKCELPNGDMLRVERMDSGYVWWCFYIGSESYHCFQFDTDTSTTIKLGKISVQTHYQNTLKYA
jgi:hypothetical protein